MISSSDPDPLAALEARIAAAQKAQAPSEGRETKYTAASLGWRMVLELVVGMALGAGIGYGADSVFGTMPIFLVLFSMLGFAAGVRTMMRTAAEVRDRRGEGARLGTPPRADDARE
ncbi:MAG: AtpZ/AtpI family protein [Pseudomonadota bacterium]